MADVEIELKFQVPAAARGALVKALATARAESLPLHAAYFDTADDRLAAAGLVLRVRREGRRWVQTLKGRGDGLLQRQEHEVPLPPQRGAPTPDPARHAGSAPGAALAAALAGGAPLEERYRTDIRRLRRVVRSGDAKIEVAFDEGRIVAGTHTLPVRELEFELLEGSPLALIGLAQRWARRYGLQLDVRTKSERGLQLARGGTPAPVAARPSTVSRDDTPAAAFAAMLRDTLAQALPNAAAVGDGAGAEALHQLRVALRRLRSVLHLCADWCPEPAAARALEAALRAPFARLGGQRDADVMAAWLAPALDAAGAPALEWPAPASPTDVAAVVRDPAFTLLMLDALRLATPNAQAAAVDATDLRAAARALLRRAWRTVRADMRAFADIDAERRHRLRKRLKRLRYVTEALLPLLPARRTARRLGALRRALDALGRCNDEVVALELWRAHLAHEPKAWFVVGLLCERHRRSIDAAARRIARLAGRATTRD